MAEVTLGADWQDFAVAVENRRRLEEAWDVPVPDMPLDELLDAAFNEELTDDEFVAALNSYLGNAEAEAE